MSEQISKRILSENKANTLYFNEDTNNHYYINAEEFFTTSSSFTSNSHLKYFHHLREDSVSYNNFSSDSPFNDYLQIHGAGHFITSDQYFCERKGLKSYLIIHTLDGCGHLSYMDQDYTLEAGDTFFIDCRKYHMYFPASNNWTFLFVHFTGSLAKTFYRESLNNGFSPFHHSSDYDIAPNIIRMITPGKNNVPHHSMICFNILNNMLTEIITKLNYHKNLSVPSYIEVVQKYIRANFHQDIQLKDLSQLANISKYHLSREYKRYTGETIQYQLINLRLDYAKNLLVHTNVSIDGITLQCGLRNCSHFIKTFKDKIGLTPLQYRKKWTSVQKGL